MTTPLLRLPAGPAIAWLRAVTPRAGARTSRTAIRRHSRSSTAGSVLRAIGRTSRTQTGQRSAQGPPPDRETVSPGPMLSARWPTAVARLRPRLRRLRLRRRLRRHPRCLRLRRRLRRHPRHPRRLRLRPHLCHRLPASLRPFPRLFLLQARCRRPRGSRRPHQLRGPHRPSLGHNRSSSFLQRARPSSCRT